MAWDESVEDVRSKAAVRNGKKLRLVEFKDSFTENEWCMKGHIGYVLDGEMEIAFPDRVEIFRGGNGIMIAGGEVQRRRARVPQTNFSYNRNMIDTSP